MVSHYYTIEGPTDIQLHNNEPGKIRITAGSTQFLWGLYIRLGGSTYTLGGTLYNQGTIELDIPAKALITMNKSNDGANSIYVTIIHLGVYYQGLFYTEGQFVPVRGKDGENLKAVVHDGSIVVKNPQI